MRLVTAGLMFALSAGAGELTVSQRNDACFALRGQRTPEVIAEMSRAIDDPNVRACAARNLRDAGAVDALLEALSHGAPDTRVAAARELGALRDGRALSALGAASLDPNALLAAAAIGALGDYEDRAALPYLLKAAEARTVAGVAALEQAARTRDASVLPVARAVLEKGDVASKVVAMAILGDLGDASDVARLRAYSAASEPVSSRGRGFGFMPAIDLSRAARTAMERIETRMR